MPRARSHITWFDEEDWIGTEIVFETPHASRCRVEQKLAESEGCVSEYDVQKIRTECSSRGVFVCSNIDDPGKEAAVKIRMQIPYFKTAYKRPPKRAEQAMPNVQPETEEEVYALKHLTAAGCSSTPAFFAWKHETQGDDGWVPGGYIDYILMERVPSSRPNYWSYHMDKEERAELRKAFKSAWIYIVDWEDWRKSTDKCVWDDSEYFSWNMSWPEGFRVLGDATIMRETWVTLVLT